jgi:hypothetical protein
MLLSDADRALGELNGSVRTLPHPELFVSMYVRKEAALSSQIEGTQASLLDVLEFEARALETGAAPDVDEIANYVCRGPVSRSPRRPRRPGGRSGGPGADPKNGPASAAPRPSQRRRPRT